MPVSLAMSRAALIGAVTLGLMVSPAMLGGWRAAGQDATGQDATGQDAGAPAQRLQVLYNGRFLGLRIMKAAVVADMTPSGYEARATFRTAGLAGLFNDTQINATGAGGVAGGLFHPREYQHKNDASKKDRLVRIETDGDTVTPVVTPPFGSMGEPPATAEVRAGAIDWLVMFINTAVNHGEEPCNRTVEIFDAKQRIDVRFELVEERILNTRAYDGPGYVCHVYYTPVAGFDPEDLADPDVYKKPFRVWLTKRDDGLTIPVRIRARISGVRVTVEAKSFRVDGERVRLDPSLDPSLDPNLAASMITNAG